MGHKPIHYFLIFVLIAGATQFSNGNPGDSLKASQYIDFKFNFIQFFNKSDFQTFYEAWKNKPKITIAHFGDSHVQPDIYSGKVRQQLQQSKGQGGLGMFFPYSIADTYSSIHYTSNHTGIWQSAKSIARKPELPLGVTGISARTTDENASFTIAFKNQLPASYKKLLIFCKQDKSSFDIQVKTGSEEILVPVGETGSDQPFLEIGLSAVPQILEVKVRKTGDHETAFELYGLSLMSEEESGLTLHAMGIGGSQYGSLLRENLFDFQFPALNADVVILDFGTNDFLYTNEIPGSLKNEIVEVIKKVRRATPKSNILLTSAQDMYRKGLNTTASVEFSELIRTIAREQHCLVYDWYWVSGGPEKMLLWERAGLAQKDLIHLTLKGYEQKGDLLVQALENTLSWYEAEEIDSLVIPVNPTQSVSDPKIILVNEEKPKPVNSATINHQIEKGESLYSIAKKYNVSVAELMELNELSSTTIIAGKTLKVVPNETSKKITSVLPESPKIIRHKIQSGETLSEIAEKYHVSVRSIKKANGLKSSRIIAGKTLIIPSAPVARDES
ncbi:MAG: LysM peptidoglycan-binding domain-containing protein [Flammeovirgaceae bacterium]|nr:LysM peptidoglycan-binding domain-containing protein [Flammeovirgaceae bacterium]